jgi:DNA-directed RNA polymerase specialized sigma24 family protein
LPDGALTWEVESRLGKIATALALDQALAEDGSPNQAGERVGESPEAMLANVELRTVLRELVVSLPELERELIERHYYRGQTLEEAAAALGRDRYWGTRVRAKAMKAIEGKLRERDFDTSSMGLISKGVT